MFFILLLTFCIFRGRKFMKYNKKYWSLSPHRKSFVQTRILFLSHFILIASSKRKEKSYKKILGLLLKLQNDFLGIQEKMIVHQWSVLNTLLKTKKNESKPISIHYYWCIGRLTIISKSAGWYKLNWLKTWGNHLLA